VLAQETNRHSDSRRRTCHRALLFDKGFREKSHFCLKAAIQELYADAGLIEQKYVDDFDATMLLRETADYRSDFSEEGAAASIWKC